MKRTIDDYLRTYSGRGLLKKFSLKDTGTWQVLGEDENPGYTGGHYQATLGYFTGVLEDVIYHAVSLPGFWSWGAGGDIKSVEIGLVSARPVDDVKQAKLAYLVRKLEALETEWTMLKLELEQLQ